jgi:tRNA (guanine37-N1)-methyltransferase
LKLRIDILTLFPELIGSAVDHSILKRAQSAGVVEITPRDLRDWTHDKRRTVDDAPFGGGAGMVLKPEPVFEAIETLRDEGSKVILLTPQGAPYTQSVARRYASSETHLILVCGHYEGFDERIREHLADEEISVGDYILTGGELAALIVTDSVVRLMPGVLGNCDSTTSESFEEDLLEYPQYTRPAVFRDWSVPEVLVSGHHAEVARWRKAEQERRTAERRPDLWDRYVSSRPADGDGKSKRAKRRADCGQS